MSHAGAGARPDVTVVLPVHNEEAVIGELVRRLTATLDEMQLCFELCFVDDGSSDRTVERIRALRETDPRITWIRLSRNFGHHCALTAGIDHARGRAVILMDSDLQDQPEEIPKLWARYQEGYDVVFARLDMRRESIFKAMLGRAFWRVFGWFTGIKLRNPGVFRVIDRRVILALRTLPERNRFLAGLFSWVGYRQTSVLVERAPRAAGTTHYSIARLLTLSIHAITNFSRAPLRLATYLAGFLGFCAFGFAGWVVYHKVVHGTSLLGWASLMVVTLTGFALVLLMLGILGEYLANVLAEVQARPLYIVGEAAGVHADVVEPSEILCAPRSAAAAGPVTGRDSR